MVIAPLLLTYPSLRSFSTGVHKCEWKGAEVWENTEAVFEVMAGFMDAATWTSHTTRLAQCLPEDWRVVFGPRLLDIPHDTFVTQLQARLESGDIRLNNLQIGPLSTEKWTTLMSLLARCTQRGIAKHITYDTRIRKQDGTIGVAVHSERVRQLRQLLGHTESITLVGLYLQYSAIYDMRALLRGFRALNIMVDPWNDTQGRYLLRHMDERRLYGEGGYKLEGVVCRVVLNPDAFPVASLALVLDAIAANKTWLGQLARFLLTIGGPTVRYQLGLQNNGGSRFSSTAADNARMTSDSAAYTRRLNDIIATIVDCRRQVAPAGWRRNAKGATYFGVVFAREVADVRWSPARVPVKTPLTRTAAGIDGSEK